MDSRRQLAPEIVFWQVVLVLVAIWMCDARTERSRYAWTHPPAKEACWFGSTYRGAPVPWLEHRWREWTLSDVFSDNHNLAVPVCVFLVALALPPVVVARGERKRRACDGRPIPQTRRDRVLAVVVITAASGWSVSLLDVVTDPESRAWRGVGSVPFSQAPARWLLDRSIDPSAPRRIVWLGEKRGELFPTPEGSGHDEKVTPGEWAGRTRRTLLGMAAGLALGCVLVRPWCKIPPADKLGAGGTSRPPREGPFTPGGAAL